MNDPEIDKIVENLNYLYFHNIKEYQKRVELIKGMNFKVYRNSAGKHKIESDIINAFGGVFKDIFGGK